MAHFAYGDTEVEVHGGVFYPTETTKLILDYFKAGMPSGQSLLDLGCGCGIVGLALSRAGYAGNVFASDVSGEAVENVRANFERYGLEVNARAGSLFEPWRGMAFDAVLDDVSGVAESIARITPWFGASVSCESGSDGTELTVEVLRSAPEFLSPNGALFFPVLTLSNYPKILDVAHDVYSDVKEVARKQFYFPRDLTVQHADVLQEAIDRKDIIVEHKFGMYVWETIIYRASSPV